MPDERPWRIEKPAEPYPRLHRLCCGDDVMAYVPDHSVAVMLMHLIQGITPQEYERYWFPRRKYSGG